MCLAWARSSIGKKILMSVSGLMLIGFIIMHLLGNLLIFRGPDALNAYAEKLRHYGALLWVARGTLMAAIIVHSITSIQLARENRRARPQTYAQYQPQTTTLAARTMLVSGVLILAYLVYHLLHFTFKVTNPGVSHGIDALGRHDIYTMVVSSFRDPRIVAVYVIGVGTVCAHLSHGIGSVPQTLGLSNERTIPVMAWAGRIASAIIFLGYISIPLSVLVGVVK